MMRSCIVLLLAMLLASSVHAFSVLPRQATAFYVGGKSAAAAGPLWAKQQKSAEKSQVNDPFTVFGPLRFIVPGLFVGQICFLVAAKLVCGLDNLEEYGRLGNAYIRANTDYQTMPIMERYEVTKQGQQIWFKNVVRDLQNGGPVKPPITTP